MSFDLVSTWTEDCGIFEYSHALLETPCLEKVLSQIFARRVSSHSQANENQTGESQSPVRIWGPEPSAARDLVKHLLRSQSDTLWFQYHPAFFDDNARAAIADALPHTCYRRKVMTVHNPDGLKDSSFIKSFTDVIIHNRETAALLGDTGEINIHTIDHFVYSRESFEQQMPAPAFTVATAGFMARNKRVPLLIEAFEIAHKMQPNLRLQILSSPLPTHSSHFEKSRIVAQIDQSPSREAISANLQPKSMPELLSALSRSQLLCLPYEDDTGEAASGAARLGVSAQVPLLLSTSSIFSDFPGGHFTLEQNSAEAIAEAILLLSQMPHLLHKKRTELDEVYARLNAEEVARLISQVLS